MFDYEILRIIWWTLIGILLMGFAVMDGFDLGAAALLPFIGRNDSERRIIINTVGPVWEGNQVWFILGGGAIFAAWPYLYAVAFSGFYAAMYVVLFALILRPVAFKFRSKMPDARWRSFWDWCLCAGGIIPPVVFGIAFGNVLQGVPFNLDETMRMTYSGTFFDLLNPFGLLCGLIGLSLFLMQGAGWLAVKTDGVIEQRARKCLIIFASTTILLFGIAGLFVINGLYGYAITSTVTMSGPSNPLLKTVVRAAGAWINVYHKHPVAVAVPVSALLGTLLVFFGVKIRKPVISFLGSSLSQIGTIGTAAVSMFPFLLPSSINPNASLTVWDSSSSKGTLVTMTLVTIVFLPIVIIYTSWVYYVLRGKVTSADIKKHGSSLY